MPSLIERLNGIVVVRGKTLIPGPALGQFGCNVILGDEADGRGQYIMAWDVNELGPWPSVSQVVTANELRRRPLE